MGSRDGGTQNFVAKRLGSLWVVQQYLKRLGVQETIDSACPMEGHAKLTHGQVISVLVGNRLRWVVGGPAERPTGSNLLQKLEWLSILLVPGDGQTQLIPPQTDEPLRKLHELIGALPFSV